MTCSIISMSEQVNLTVLQAHVILCNEIYENNKSHLDVKAKDLMW